MKRKLEFRLLLVLLILLIIPYCIPLVVDSSDITNPRNPSTLHDVSVSSESDIIFTWTSRWQIEPQPVENGSTLVGDHVVIKSRWNIPVTTSRISIRQGISENGSIVVDIDSLSGNPSEVSYDTYNLLGNYTVNITLFGWNATSTLTVEFRNISICNFFAPEVTDIVAQSIAPNIWNISWSCSDKNANDTNYFLLWISADSGITYQLLAINLTKSHYVWDSTGFSLLEYLVRIRAFSLDLTLGNYCSTASPPTSYWPGDFSDVTIELDAGDVHSWPPGFYSITFDDHPDIVYSEGMTGNVVVWIPTFHYSQPYVVEYQVYCNNTLWTSGEYYPSSDQVIEVNVDGLEIGTYEFRIEMDWRTLHYVTVTVYPSNNNLASPWSQLIHYGAIGVAIGSSLVIITVVVMTIRLWRNNGSKIHYYILPISS
ncbi:MAG: hypothetical protein KGD60_04545 [Candidatus Thorarchaeota archaeon]|nr:hypothetical protein [Candidatus Thorarchaeota archaeon]